MAELVIEAGRAERQYWRDLWYYRELFYFLSWRDLLVRYKQTVVGVSWSVIRPFLTMLVLTLVFGKLGKMPSGALPAAGFLRDAAMELLLDGYDGEQRKSDLEFKFDI